MPNLSKDYLLSDSIILPVFDIIEKNDDISQPSIVTLLSNICNFWYIDPIYFKCVADSDWFDPIKYKQEIDSAFGSYPHITGIPMLYKYKDRFRYVYKNGATREVDGLAVGRIEAGNCLPLLYFFKTNDDKMIFEKAIRNEKD